MNLAHRISLLLVSLCVARAHCEYALRDGDTVVFLGDSITAARQYGKLIETYTLLRFPERKVRFINAGRGGETAKGSLDRLEKDVFAQGATVVTVAYGVNDIGWGLKADDAHKSEYLQAIGELIDRCQKRGVRVFICAAAITAEDPDKAEHGFLQGMCDEGLALAKAKGAGAIDVQRLMRAVQRRVLAANAKQPDKGKPVRLHAEDGVHLNDLGQLAMGFAILKGLGAPADVSAATVDATQGALITAESCAISEIQRVDNSLTFTRTDERLPLNLAPLWTLHGLYIPFGEELNRYLLTIKNLPEGRYEMTAGGRPLGSWTATELGRGINIASATADPWQPGGPWHAQAHAVKVFTDMRDELAFARRGIDETLTSHPRLAQLQARTRALEESLIELQREMARPVPVQFVVRRESPKPPSAAQFSPASSMARIALAADGKGFIHASSKTAFHPWGVNYGNRGRLIEDFWDTEWQTLVDDFRKIKQIGGNIVRVHLQFGRFMEGSDKPNAAALQQLGRLLQLAEATGLYVDVTGLACYRPSDTPQWYDALDDADRWEAQAAFWRAVAGQCASSPAVFCYDLMNEPIAPGGKGDRWYSGKLLGPYDFVQFIARNPAGRTRGEIAAAWIDKLTAAIRERDPERLVTVGMLPWVTGWQHLSGFVPKEVAPHLGFLSVHIYPKSKAPDEALRALRECDVGKAVVIEETFPLECSSEELETFLRGSHDIASGWIFHYDGATVEELDAIERENKLTLAQELWRGGLRTFVKLKAELAPSAEE